MSATGRFHTVFAVAAIIFGAVMLLRPKGTRSHRRIGWVYVAAMVGLNVTALAIYRLTGRFGPFHAGAILSLATVLAGFVVALRRHTHADWLQKHYLWMTYSYVGLLAAAASEILTRLPAAPFWWAVAGASALVFAVGAMMIHRRQKRVLAPFA
jgi:uncharacterized membrane protein